MAWQSQCLTREGPGREPGPALKPSYLRHAALPWLYFRFSHFALLSAVGWVLSPEDKMVSILTAVTLSFLTLCLGTYVADRLEARSTACVHGRDGRQTS
jgi:hypothetical protein